MFSVTPSPYCFDARNLLSEVKAFSGHFIIAQMADRKFCSFY